MTCAPSRARASAIAYPIPAVDPVTSARFPSSSKFILVWMREVSFWTQFSGKPAKVVQFLSVTGDIEFDYGVVSMSKIAAVTSLALQWGLFAALGSPGLLASAVPTGLFEGHADVGSVAHPRILEYDPAQRIYTTGPTAESPRTTADALHFSWQAVTRDASLACGIS